MVCSRLHKKSCWQYTVFALWMMCCTGVGCMLTWVHTNLLVVHKAFSFKTNSINMTLYFRRQGTKYIHRNYPIVAKTNGEENAIKCTWSF